MTGECHLPRTSNRRFPFSWSPALTRRCASMLTACAVMTNQWTPEGRIEWCWLQLGNAALMLQEYRQREDHPGRPDGSLGQGVSVCFMCADAITIYHELIARGIGAQRPFVGNGLWVTSVQDPDGFRLDFESPTDVPEETVYQG